MTASDTAPAPYTDLDRMPIAGDWRSGRSGSRSVDTNPYTGQVLTEVELADSDDVDAAYHAANRAQRDWARLAPADRQEVFLRAARIIDDRKEEIIDWLVHEAGAARVRAEWEWGITRATMHEVASYPSRVQGRILPAEPPGKESRVYRRPVGVVGVISPWNFPMHLSNRSVAPALAVGNGVVLKPAGDTPVTGGLLLARIYQEAGLPSDLLSVIVGRGRDIGDSVVKHRHARVVSFTGSTPVGESIAQSAGIRKLALELGGNGPLVILDDANVERAVDGAIFGSYFHQGQICMATNRVIVDQSIFEDFVDRFLRRTREIRIGDPRDPDTQLGPIINPDQLGTIREKVDRAVRDGAQLLQSGEPEGPIGSVLPPHVLTGGNDVATAAEEVFGPVATIVPAADEDEALRLANDTEYGLSSGVYTADSDRGLRFACNLEAGMTHINDTTVNDEINTAFGGEKSSGLGRFGGDWAIDEFTTDHWISVQHQPRPFPL